MHIAYSSCVPEIPGDLEMIENKSISSLGQLNGGMIMKLKLKVLLKDHDPAVQEAINNEDFRRQSLTRVLDNNDGKGAQAMCKAIEKYIKGDGTKHVNILQLQDMKEKGSIGIDILTSEHKVSMAHIEKVIADNDAEEATRLLNLSQG